MKGQEENTLTALGIVVGLTGTGDGGDFVATIRSLGMAMEFLGSPVGAAGISELKDAKNVALVTVDVTVPAAGCRQGDKLDCMVSSIGTAKSLAGGRLFLTPMLGPVPGVDSPVFGFSKGPITIENEEMLTTGRIHNGCQMEQDFFNPFTKDDDKITLVLSKDYADFLVAQDVVELINASELVFQNNGIPIAIALDQVNIEVEIPRQYVQEPVLFVAQILELELMEPRTAARVWINERAGTIILGGDVEIGPVVVTHKNIIVEAAAGSQFVPIDTSDPENPKLKDLVEALRGVNVPNADIIDIIKGIERDGKLYGQLIVE